MKTHRQELVVYVVWHPEYSAGREMAKLVYDQLTRDSAVPLSRGLGIPVYLRTAANSREVPPAIAFDEATHTVVVLLVDDKMVLGRGQGWGSYADALVAEAATGAHRVLPIKLSASAFTLSRQLRAANFLTLDSVPAEARPQRLLVGLLHDLCRLMQDEPPAEYQASDANARPAAIAKPVRIFISHAKKDGEALALEIREYITKNLQLDTFFDKNQIYYGEDFTRVLEQNVEQSAILVLQTDAYSSREWCQREVLVAKRHGRPVLVLHKVDVGETRSFPYLGNLPVLRFKDEMPIDHVLGRLLLEVLRSEYFPRYVRGLARLFDKPLENLEPMARTPELLNLPPSEAAGKTVVYPDPPLGNHEVELLREFNEARQVTTPLFLLAGTPSLSRVLVGLSLSEIAPDLQLDGDPDSQLDGELQRLGLLRAHFDDAMCEVARFLLASGADLAYGGDLREGGFTEKLHDLVRLYSETQPPDQPPRLRIENFLAWVAHTGKDERLLKFMECLEPRRLPLPADVVDELEIDSQHTGPPPFDANTPESNYLNARCFTAMREAMNATIAARILLGGRLTGYSGKYPGLVEEAYLALREGLPLYLIGGFGGCTSAIIDAVEGKPPTDLTFDGQLHLDERFRQQDPAQAKTSYRDRVEDFNRRAANHSNIEPIDYDAVLGCMASNGIAGLSEHNGLTPEENRRLFTTPHVAEIIYLVLKGLNQLRAAGRLRITNLDS
ncbi:MAG: TIR domain-containing protein [Candidatus Paceibacterota bacterium]